jgi:hypothetical protein
LQPEITAILVPWNARGVSQRLRWRNVYREAELYKAAVALYTKPLFTWRKALFASTDGHDLYDFAASGLQNLSGIHRNLAGECFMFRPGVALHRNFRGKPRTLYVYPWEERLVDLLLYRLLSARFDHIFSRHSYAYRMHGFGLDRCQHKIARELGGRRAPLYVAKRDIASYFPSICHTVLTMQLAEFIEPSDYLFRLLEQRMRFECDDRGSLTVAKQGIPFGTPIACFFANFRVVPTGKRISLNLERIENARRSSLLSPPIPALQLMNAASSTTT